ncbi:MAG: hypothetical protein GY885_19050 [Phycisphaeraceae bacterium]|nr:hypothetical protein [Phycisphaeraceae bacterium]
MIHLERRCTEAHPSNGTAGGATAAAPKRRRFTATNPLTWFVTALVLAGCTASPPKTTLSAAPASTTTAPDPLVLVRAAADHEALYTLAGGLKPMSSGFWRGSFDVEDPDVSEITAVRASLGVLRNDVWHADVQVFARADEGTRSAHAYVIHREALARMIERHESFWSPWGITAGTHPAEVVAIVDRMPRADRWRGYGYLFGYPDHAVDFFVEAGVAADDGRAVGPGKDREFIHLPTHATDSGQFTYAVPPGHVPTMADRRLAEHADLILAAYEQRRARMSDPRRTAEELLRLNARFEHLGRTGVGPVR